MTAKITDAKTIEVYDRSQFDVDAIMHSGQVFRYFEREGGYRLIVGKNCANIFKSENKIIIKSNDSAYFWNYFDLETDYNAIKRELSVFDKIRPSMDAGGGIRILRSDFVEIVISFIISANNNIKRFTKTLNLLAERYGDRLENGSYAFPSLEQLLAITESEYKTLGCGYRSAYLVKAAKQLAETDRQKLAELPNDLLRKKLSEICGVGPKVCACVMLFCGDFHRLDVAPVDTWIGKALNQLTDIERTALLSHKYAGIAQQYMFYRFQYLHMELE